MLEPWEVKIDDSREEDSKKVFIIFCEDGAVEPAYFETFKRKDVHVSAFGNKKQHHAQVDFATEYFRKGGLLEVIEVNGVIQEILKQSFPHEAKIQNQRFDYYTTMKSKENFNRYTYQLMKGSIDIAVQRAEKLEAIHLTKPPKAIHLHCPCTKVHWLVKELRS